jgi:hypothetical protein
MNLRRHFCSQISVLVSEQRIRNRQRVLNIAFSSLILFRFTPLHRDVY